MAVLKKRFGRLVAAHRARRGLTQERLAELADLSIDMVAKIEIGATGVSFPTVERLAKALDIDVGELFSPSLRPTGQGDRQRRELLLLLADRSDAELAWIAGIVKSVLAGSPGRRKQRGAAGRK